jgi:hypothetical protein
MESPLRRFSLALLGYLLTLAILVCTASGCASTPALSGSSTPVYLGSSEDGAADFTGACDTLRARFRRTPVIAHNGVRVWCF